ncbi:MAG: hypothetical protein H7332_09745 [Bdellovibrionales bacterium]|nr:hypothetical protein [Ramlibacter sp.]
MNQLSRLCTPLFLLMLAGCASTSAPGKLDNTQIRDEVVQTGPAEYRLTAYGAEVHEASQVLRAFEARATKLCAPGMARHPAVKSEPYQYDTGVGAAGNPTAAHSAFKATGVVTCVAK